MMKTNKEKELLTLEGTLAQLRHAYAQLMAAETGAWPHAQRRALADGLLHPQIKALEGFVVDYERAKEDLAASLTVNARYRQRIKDIREKLLAQAGLIASASEARRIIFTIFEQDARRP